MTQARLCYGAWVRFFRRRSTALFASQAILLLGNNEVVLAVREESCCRYMLVCLCWLLAIKGVAPKRTSNESFHINNSSRRLQSFFRKSDPDGTSQSSTTSYDNELNEVADSSLGQDEQQMERMN